MSLSVGCHIYFFNTIQNPSPRLISHEQSQWQKLVLKYIVFYNYFTASPTFKFWETAAPPRSTCWFYIVTAHARNFVKFHMFWKWNKPIEINRYTENSSILRRKLLSSPPCSTETEGLSFRENLEEGRKISELWAAVPGLHRVRRASEMAPLISATPRMCRSIDFRTLCT